MSDSKGSERNGDDIVGIDLFESENADWEADGSMGSEESME